MRKRVCKPRGFTLVELLVVISIIALLMSITFPSLRSAREQAKRSVCMSNLRQIGHSIHIYGIDNNGRLIPGNAPSPWAVWGRVYEPPGTGKYQAVNLGYLLEPLGALPFPVGNKHVLFCPSTKHPENETIYEGLKVFWGTKKTTVPVSYMFNIDLDGFGLYPDYGGQRFLAHMNRVHYLRGDSSVDTFRIKPLIYDEAVGPEMLDEVCFRYGINFPSLMLHQWFENDEINLTEAKEYLSNPLRWYAHNETDKLGKPVLLANIGNKSLVSDVAGIWSGVSSESGDYG
ncbi:MAG: type II secretion system protein [Planctomycetota bacterium]|jgi:prepilin-type N-terminal cleavage/methylation domain-containing protein